jgi:hypothetical protein
LFILSLLIPEKIGHQVKGGAGNRFDMGYTKNEFPAADRFNVSNFLKYFQKESCRGQAEQPRHKEDKKQGMGKVPGTDGE